MLPLALALFASAIGLVIWTLASSADEKATVRDSLRQLEGQDSPAANTISDDVMARFPPPPNVQHDK